LHETAAAPSFNVIGSSNAHPIFSHQCTSFRRVI
jgi:hypothetical protein